MNETFKGTMAVLIAAILWGSTGTVASFAPEVSAFTIGAAAMGGGGLLQALWAWRSMSHAKSGIWQQKRFWLLGAVAVAIYPLAFYGSMRLAGIAVGTAITIGAAPLFSALIERMLEGKALEKRWFLFTSVSIVGVMLLCLGKNSSATPQPHYLQGIMLGVVAAFTYAFYSWTARQMMLHHIPTAAAMGATFGLGALFLLPIIVFSGKALWASAGNLLVGVYMASVPMFVGYLAFGYGLARIEASRAVGITLFEPVVAAGLAVGVAGERLTFTVALGMALIMGSLVGISMPKPAPQPS